MRLVSSLRHCFLALSLGALLASAPAFAATVVNTNITEADVKAAQDG